MGRTKRIWRESQHPRDARGRFARRGGEAWIKRAATELISEAGAATRDAGGRSRISRNAKAGAVLQAHAQGGRPSAVRVPKAVKTAAPTVNVERFNAPDAPQAPAVPKKRTPRPSPGAAALIAARAAEQAPQMPAMRAARTTPETTPVESVSGYAAMRRHTLVSLAKAAGIDVRGKSNTELGSELAAHDERVKASRAAKLNPSGVGQVDTPRDGRNDGGMTSTTPNPILSDSELRSILGNSVPGSPQAMAAQNELNARRLGIPPSALPQQEESKRPGYLDDIDDKVRELDARDRRRAADLPVPETSGGRDVARRASNLAKEGDIEGALRELQQGARNTTSRAEAEKLEAIHRALLDARLKRRSEQGEQAHPLDAWAQRALAEMNSISREVDEINASQGRPTSRGDSAEDLSIGETLAEIRRHPTFDRDARAARAAEAERTATDEVRAALGDYSFEGSTLRARLRTALESRANMQAQLDERRAALANARAAHARISDPGYAELQERETLRPLQQEVEQLEYKVIQFDGDAERARRDIAEAVRKGGKRLAESLDREARDRASGTTRSGGYGLHDERRDEGDRRAAHGQYFSDAIRRGIRDLDNGQVTPEQRERLNGLNNPAMEAVRSTLAARERRDLALSRLAALEGESDGGDARYRAALDAEIATERAGLAKAEAELSTLEPQYRATVDALVAGINEVRQSQGKKPFKLNEKTLETGYAKRLKARSINPPNGPTRAGDVPPAAPVAQRVPAEAPTPASSGPKFQTLYQRLGDGMTDRERLEASLRREEQQQRQRAAEAERARQAEEARANDTRSEREKLEEQLQQDRTVRDIGMRSGRVDSQREARIRRNEARLEEIRTEERKAQIKGYRKGDRVKTTYNDETIEVEVVGKTKDGYLRVLLPNGRRGNLHPKFIEGAAPAPKADAAKVAAPARARISPDAKRGAIQRARDEAAAAARSANLEKARAAATEKKVAELRASSDPRDNSAKIRAITDGRMESADLYRQIHAGPSGQRSNINVGRVRHTPDNQTGEYTVTAPGGERVGYATSVVRDGEQRYAVYSDNGDGGTELLGWADSLAHAADVLTNGEAAASTGGTLDARRISGRLFERNPNRNKSLAELEREALNREIKQVQESLANPRLGPQQRASAERRLARLEAERRGEPEPETSAPAPTEREAKLAAKRAELEAAQQRAQKLAEWRPYGSAKRKSFGVRVDANLRNTAQVHRDIERLEREIKALERPEAPKVGPVNLDDIKPGSIIKRGGQYYRVVKVNAKSIKVEMPPGWDDLFKKDAKITEVHPPKAEAAQVAASARGRITQDMKRGALARVDTSRVMSQNGGASNSPTTEATMARTAASTGTPQLGVTESSRGRTTTVTLPDGTTAQRTSKTMTYTHAVVGTTDEHANARDRRALADRLDAYAEALEAWIADGSDLSKLKRFYTGTGSIRDDERGLRSYGYYLPGFEPIRHQTKRGTVYYQASAGGPTVEYAKLFKDGTSPALEDWEKEYHGPEAQRNTLKQARERAAKLREEAAKLEAGPQYSYHVPRWSQRADTAHAAIGSPEVNAPNTRYQVVSVGGVADKQSKPARVVPTAEEKAAALEKKKADEKARQAASDARFVEDNRQRVLNRIERGEDPDEALNGISEKGLRFLAKAVGAKLPRLPRTAYGTSQPLDRAQARQLIIEAIRRESPAKTAPATPVGDRAKAPVPADLVGGAGARRNADGTITIGGLREDQQWVNARGGIVRHPSQTQIILGEVKLRTVPTPGTGPGTLPVGATDADRAAARPRLEIDGKPESDRAYAIRTAPTREAALSILNGYQLPGLRAIARDEGIVTSGTKKDLVARLIRVLRDRYEDSQAITRIVNRT